MTQDVAPESRYWNERIETLGRYLSVGHASYSDRVNRRRKESLFRTLDEILGRLMPDGLQGRSVLDAGCGTGIYSAFYADRGAQVTGVDAAASAVDKCREIVPSGTFIHGGLASIPVEDASQDLVHCFSVLYHIMDDADWSSAIGELMRVTRPDGIIVLRAEKVPQDAPVGQIQTLRAWHRYEKHFGAGGWHLVEEHTIRDVPRFSFRGRRFGPFTMDPLQRVMVFRHETADT